MKLKTLLYASAATLVASGAQAADAVVVEAEPMEYIKICDAYGAGFFALPGTEACMKIGGYLRSHGVRSSGMEYSLHIDEQEAKDAVADEKGTLIKKAIPEFNEVNTLFKSLAASSWSNRGRLNIDVRNETDYGTLRAFLRLEGTHDAGGAPPTASVKQALISIAGLRAGLGNSLFNANYTGVNLPGLGSHKSSSRANAYSVSDESAYGFSSGHVMDYTFNIGDLSLSAGIETPSGEALEDSSLLAKAEYSSDGLTVGAVGDWQQDGDAAYKVYGNVSLADVMPSASIGGWYMMQDLDVSEKTDSDGVTRVGYDNVWAITGQVNLTDDVELVGLYSHLNNSKYAADIFEADEVFYTVTDTGGIDTQVATAAVNWYPISGLKIFGSYSFAKSQADKMKLSTKTNKGLDATLESTSNVFTVGLVRSF